MHQPAALASQACLRRFRILRGCCRDEIKIARSPQGKKMRIGEGGSGTVYKALMHGCDEVAVKVVRTAHPAPEEAVAFQKEVWTLFCNAPSPNPSSSPAVSILPVCYSVMQV